MSRVVDADEAGEETGKGCCGDEFGAEEVVFVFVEGCFDVFWQRIGEGAE